MYFKGVFLFFFFFLTFLVVALSAVVLCVYNDVVLGLTWVAAKEKFIFEPQAKMSRKKLAAQQLNCNTVSKTQPFSFFFFFFHHQLCAILIHKGTVWHFLSVVCCIVFGSFVGSLKVSFFWCCTYCCFLLPNKQKKTLRCITALWLLSLSVRLGPFVAGYQVLAAQFRLW